MTIEITRREVLAGAGAIGAATLLPAMANAAPGDAAAGAVLADIAEELLADYPENALYLGIDKGKRAVLRSRFADRTHAADLDRAGRATKRLAQLRAIDRHSLSNAVALDADTAQSAYELAVA
ncbi:MAG: DUF885 domain-containing protein, partial [Sphingomonas sp.]